MIPVHNCADYLAQALPEVVSQLASREDVEIIVVDDASSDNPEQVVDRLGLGRVRYRPNPGHLGAIGTFNRCLALATGELVHLLHGDDAVLPGFYGAMEQALAEPTVVAAVCRVRDLDAHNTPLYMTRSYRKGTGVWTNALEAFAVSNRVRAPGIVVPHAAYEHVGGYRTDLPHAADWDMWTRFAAQGPFVFVDEVLAVYRRHDSSDSWPRIRTGANVRERVAAIAWSALCRANAGHDHTQGAGVLGRVRRPYGSVTGQGRRLVRRRPTGLRGGPLWVDDAGWRPGARAPIPAGQRVGHGGLIWGQGVRAKSR